MQRARKTESLQTKLVKGTDRGRTGTRAPRTNRANRTNYTEPEFDTSDPVLPEFMQKHKHATAIWDEYMGMGMGLKILTAPDARMFATYCVMCAEFSERITDGLGTPPAAWLAQMRMYAELFGCVPAGRTRIHEKPQRGKGQTNAQDGETPDETPDFFGEYPRAAG